MYGNTVMEVTINSPKSTGDLQPTHHMPYRFTLTALIAAFPSSPSAKAK